eukprot:Gb_10142 [translate_table: standard]
MEEVVEEPTSTKEEEEHGREEMVADMSNNEEVINNETITIIFPIAMEKRWGRLNQGYEELLQTMLDFRPYHFAQKHTLPPTPLIECNLNIMLVGNRWRRRHLSSTLKIFSYLYPNMGLGQLPMVVAWPNARNRLFFAGGLEGNYGVSRGSVSGSTRPWAQFPFRLCRCGLFVAQLVCFFCVRAEVFAVWEVGFLARSEVYNM